MTAKPKRRGDRHSLIRGVPGTITPPQYKKPPRVTGARPEAELQAMVNQLLDRMGVYYFRLSAQILSGHGDKSVGGWPDNPIIIPIAPGMSLIFPLELKKQGETMRPNQLEMAERIGTICADNWEDACRFIAWADQTAEKVRNLMKNSGFKGYENK